MKFVFTADIHLRWWQDKDVDETGAPLKLVETLNALEQMCKYAVDNNIKDIFIGGDINDTKSIISTRALIMFKRLMWKYKDSIIFHLIPGNHDTTHRVMDYHAAQIFEGMPSVSIYNTINEDNDNITILPWSPNLAEELKNLSPNDILISHFGLTDAHLSTGMSVKTGINAEDLSKFKLVLLGHYHCPQHLHNVYYVGSPVPFRRDEADEIKRFLVVDTETLEVESVPTDGYRKYKQIILDENTNLKQVEEDIERSRGSNDFIILKKNIKKIPSSLSEKLEDIQIVDVYDEDSQIRGISSSMDIREQMEKYLEIMQVDKDELRDYISVLEEVLRSDD